MKFSFVSHIFSEIEQRTAELIAHQYVILLSINASSHNQDPWAWLSANALNSVYVILILVSRYREILLGFHSLDAHWEQLPTALSATIKQKKQRMDA